MFGRETRMLLRHYLEHGTSKSALARELGVSRDTIHRWIRDGDLDRDLDDTPVPYGPRRPIPTKLDRYRADHRDSPRGVSGAVGRATARGDPRRRVHRRVLPADRVGAAAAARPDARAGGALRDAGRSPGAGGLRGVPASRGASATRLLVVLGYSRLLWCRFGARQDMRTLVTGLEDAFLAMGGVPQELLFDQMKAVITRDLRLQGGAWCAISSSSALRTIGASRRARVGPIAPRPRARWSVRCATSERISCTAARSSMTPTWRSSAPIGWSASPMRGAMPPRRRHHASASSATSDGCSCRCPHAATRRWCSMRRR